MKVLLNPGHDRTRDSGAVNPYSGLRECDVAADIGERVRGYLAAAGCTVHVIQSDNLCGEVPTLPCVVDTANSWPADVVVSLHCNAAHGNAQGTEELVYVTGGESEKLADCIQRQIVNSCGTVDRGIKERPHLMVLNSTDMPAVIVEMAFIDNFEDSQILTLHADEMARAIARGVTDYECMCEGSN